MCTRQIKTVVVEMDIMLGGRSGIGSTGVDVVSPP